MSSFQPANARIAKRIELGSSLAIFHVAPDVGRTPDFTPGQFTNVGLPIVGQDGVERFVRRAFSMANSPRATSFFELFVRRIEGGEFTTRLFELREGDRLWLDPNVYGKFTLDELAPGRDVVWISSGTGVAPFVSMLRTYGDAPRWRRLALFESVRVADDLGFRAELEARAASDSNFAYVPTATREAPESTWRGARSRLQTLIEPENFARLVGWPLEPAVASVFCCGNPAMIEDVAQLLAARGFRPHSRRNPGELHVERYW